MWLWIICPCAGGLVSQCGSAIKSLWVRFDGYNGCPKTNKLFILIGTWHWCHNQDIVHAKDCIGNKPALHVQWKCAILYSDSHRGIVIYKGGHGRVIASGNLEILMINTLSFEASTSVHILIITSERPGVEAESVVREAPMQDTIWFLVESNQWLKKMTPDDS